MRIFFEVLDYCRRSAGQSGRLLLHLFDERGFRAACVSAICSALQLINFWQDVEVDYRKDARICLPQDEMARFGVTEGHLKDRICDSAWRFPDGFQVDRARKLILSGSELGQTLPGASASEIRAASRAACESSKRSSTRATTFRRRPEAPRVHDWPLLLAKAL